MESRKAEAAQLVQKLRQEEHCCLTQTCTDWSEVAGQGPEGMGKINQKDRNNTCLGMYTFICMCGGRNREM